MKKFFTLFALLSVGLTAWAQEGPFRFLLNGPIIEIDGIEDGPIQYFDFDDIESYREIIYLENGFYRTYVLYPENEEEKNYEDDFSVKYGAAWVPFHGKIQVTYPHNDKYPNVVPSFDFEFKDDDSKPFYSYMVEGKNTVYKPKYTRECASQWGTLCLPFSFEPAHYSNVTFYSFDKVEGDVMHFNKIEEQIPAGQPVVFKLNDGPGVLTISEGENEPVELALTPIEPTTSVWKLHGTFKSINSESDIFYYLSKDTTGEGIFYGTNITVLPYRAWFTGPTPNGAPLRISIDDSESLQFVEQVDGTLKVSYDLLGRKLDDARKGLMIENGKVIMVK